MTTLSAQILAFSALLLGGSDEVRVTVAVPEKPRMVSPYIYGVNQIPGGDPSLFTMVRLGGNRLTAYNWENNASNAGTDFHNQSDDFLGGGDTPGEVVRSIVSQAMGRKQAALVTVPMTDYVAAEKKGGGDVNRTPDYLKTRFRRNLAGKGRPFANPPDSNDAEVYQDEFVAWLEAAFPAEKRPAPIFYALDNEPDLWSHTHPRIHPEKVTYQELIDRTVEWSKSIKRVAPRAAVFGFVSYGYQGFVRLSDAPDANNRDFTEVFLTAMARAEKESGKRLVDVLDLHWYPETYSPNPDGKRITEGGDAEPVALARVQAPRHLYDPSFRENSWIDRDALHEPIRLLPRIQQKIDTFYPGTKLAITEYNYGGPDHISGALAQADVLGAFAAHDVFAAAWWSLGGKGNFVAAAFRLYRDYDGKGSGFGTRSLDASSSDLFRVSSWAASTESGALTIVLINRDAADVTIALDGAPLRGKSTAQAYHLTAAKSAIVAGPRVDLSQSVSLPAMSATLLEIR